MLSAIIPDYNEAQILGNALLKTAKMKAAKKKKSHKTY